MKNLPSKGWKVWWDVYFLSWLVATYLQKPFTNLHPSTSPVSISTVCGGYEKKAHPWEVFLSCVFRDKSSVMYSAKPPGLRSPILTCAIRKAIRSNHTLLANYCLWQGGSLKMRPAVETYLCSIMSSTVASPRIHQMFPQFTLLQALPQEYRTLCSFLMDFNLWPKGVDLKIAV